MRSALLLPSCLQPTLLATGVGLALVATLPVKAAEAIYFDYGYLSRSLPVSALETFAKTGKVFLISTVSDSGILQASQEFRSRL